MNQVKLTRSVKNSLNLYSDSLQKDENENKFNEKILLKKCNIASNLK